MPDRERPPSLVADLGATNARFALVGRNGVEQPVILRCADHPSLVSAVGAYLDQVVAPMPPRQAAIAVAGPVTGDQVALTNHPWSFSTTELKSQLALERLEVVNDFAAVALAAPHLGPADLMPIGGGTAQAGQPIGVIGPGTGLGVGGVVPAGGGWIALAGEGGHVTMPACGDREAAVLAQLRRRFHHVSAERVLSGMGLTNLYEALAQLADQDDVQPREPQEVAEAGLAGGDPVAAEAIAMFCAMLGTIAGNLALTLGARGGVFIAGGIVPRLGSYFAGSAFRERFEAKGRLRAYLRQIPTAVVTHKLPAFVGLKAILDRPA